MVVPQRQAEPKTCHAMYGSSLATGGVEHSGWASDPGEAAMQSDFEWRTACAVL